MVAKYTPDEVPQEPTALERALARLRPAAPSARVRQMLEHELEAPVASLPLRWTRWADRMLIGSMISGAVAACVSVTLLLTDPAAVAPAPQSPQVTVARSNSAVVAARVYLAHMEAGESATMHAPDGPASGGPTP